ncbi:hypothetical protein SLA2020_170320 [Shorea laevis]
MSEIFRMTVENTNDNKMLKLSVLQFQQLPTGEFSVTDNQSNETWTCLRGERSCGGQYYLSVKDRWHDFVKALRIKAGSSISLHKVEDPFGRAPPSYEFEVKN